jgi:hypothetical protein
VRGAESQNRNRLMTIKKYPSRQLIRAGRGTFDCL